MSADSSSWQRWRPSADEPWNLQRVVHLHRRAGFAATWSEIQRDLAEGPQASLDRILSGKSHTTGVPDDFAQMADVIGAAAVASGNSDRLEAWWLYRMLFSPDPLSERIALMWHNHFATSNLKVDDDALMHQQNAIFRDYGRSCFGELLPLVVKHPAMLVWLDAQTNRKDHPNENLARELMELFTLGVGHYTEADVQEAARSLTGWTVVNDSFREFDEYHDGGTKTIMGHTGNFRGDDLLPILLEHPATSRRIAWRICNTFMGEDTVSQAAVDDLAAGLREHELDVGWAVETVLRSNAFFASTNLGNRVLSPVEFAVGAVRALEVFDPPASTFLLAEQVGRCGQELFHPPSVFGWEGGRAWINTRSLIATDNFVATLLDGKLHSPPCRFDAGALAQRHGIACDPESLCRFFLQLLTVQDPPDDFINRLIDVAVSDKGADQVATGLVRSILAAPSAHLG